MPLTVNVGISRKASANYQSAELSINLTAELDQSLLADPPRLQSEIDRIYRQAEEALDRKAGGVTARREQGIARRVSAPGPSLVASGWQRGCLEPREGGAGANRS